MFRNYPNDRLLDELRSTYGNERTSVVKVIRLLEEVDRRRLYAELGYSSLFRFCQKVLNLSEHEACMRIGIARLAERFPILLEMLSSGEIHLSGLSKLSRHLTVENHRALLDAARHKSKRQIEELIADWFPKPDERSSIRKLPAPPPPSPLGLELPLTPAPVAQRTEPEVRTTQVPASAPAVPAAAPRPGVVQPLAVDRYAVKFTATKRCRELIDRAKALMSHRAPNADVSDVVEEALEAFVAQLEKKKFKTTDRPRSQATPPRSTNSRQIPAAIQRAVAARDAGRCTHVAPDGTRCEEMRFLEYDHIVPVARGGEHSVANVRLRCRTHNALAARQEFGDEYVELRASGFRPSAAAVRSGSKTTAADDARPGSTPISRPTLWLFAPEPSADGR